MNQPKAMTANQARRTWCGSCRAACRVSYEEAEQGAAVLSASLYFTQREQWGVVECPKFVIVHISLGGKTESPVYHCKVLNPVPKIFATGPPCPYPPPKYTPGSVTPGGRS
jgi:hypothetical protein